MSIHDFPRGKRRDQFILDFRHDVAHAISSEPKRIERSHSTSFALALSTMEPPMTCFLSLVSVELKEELHGERHIVVEFEISHAPGALPPSKMRAILLSQVNTNTHVRAPCRLRRIPDGRSKTSQVSSIRGN